MDELLNKISSYNIFNYLFPGAIFAILASRFGIMQIPTDQIVGQLLWFYFVGMSVSRVGSVIAEPALRKASFINFVNYPHFLRASANDPKMEAMVEVANTYRTLATGFALLLIGMGSAFAVRSAGLPSAWQDKAMIAMLLALFLFSFRKHAAFVAQRVEHFKGGDV
ncbi:MULTISPECIES: hypothetical protein [unclassified Sphingobium]|uniref:hypothetical protein n=1 Tax=unclassified Sphingobium TaxID=2611147 RepID=UPI00222523E2|nr:MULTISPECIES: hypothetical protein [unclassified Sphingobium]MCW2412922.1 hypothetical protein [Sphingobium sp. B8D3D]MCW2414780.1 hypothetical protein [Sphingobium sp. B8D3A]